MLHDEKHIVNYFLKGTINKQPGLSRLGIFKALIKSVRSFFDLKAMSTARCSRIRRRHNKSFEEFIFKGYDQQTPGLFRPGSFKELKFICKN